MQGSTDISGTKITLNNYWKRSFLHFIPVCPHFLVVNLFQIPVLVFILLSTKGVYYQTRYCQRHFWFLSPYFLLAERGSRPSCTCLVSIPYLLWTCSPPSCLQVFLFPWELELMYSLMKSLCIALSLSGPLMREFVFSFWSVGIKLSKSDDESQITKTYAYIINLPAKWSVNGTVGKMVRSDGTVCKMVDSDLNSRQNGSFRWNSWQNSSFRSQQSAK